MRSHIDINSNGSWTGMLVFQAFSLGFWNGTDFLPWCPLRVIDPEMSLIKIKKHNLLNPIYCHFTSRFCGILFYVFSKHFLLSRILHNIDRNIPRSGHETLQYAPTVWPCSLSASYRRDTASLLRSSACVALSHCQDTLQVKHT